jgi:hypothetical protein
MAESVEVAIPTAQSVVYCASFQLAWNHLCDEIIKQPSLCLEGDPPMALALNRRLIQASDLDEQTYLAMAGFARDGIGERVRSALCEKFGREPLSDIRLSAPNDILAYAYLEKTLRFPTTFPVFDEPLKFSDGVAVESFGIYEPNPALAQVEILDYRDRDDFIIRLGDNDRDRLWYDGAGFSDDLILAKVPPSPTLQETVDAVLTRTTPEARRAAERALYEAGRDSRRILNPKLQPAEETLQIPKIALDVQQSYQVLIGKLLCNPGWEGYYVSKALQAVKFNLDETGVILRSDAAFGLTMGIVEEPRQFIFDKPFLVCLKKHEARYPYLAVWVGNSEVLVKHEEDV